MKTEHIEPRQPVNPTRFSIRTFRRFPVQCRAYYSHDEGHGSGTIWNLSLNGWRIDGTLPVRPGMVLSLWVLPSNDAPTLFVDRATVRWSRGLEFGLETATIREKEADCLKRLVESLV